MNRNHNAAGRTELNSRLADGARAALERIARGNALAEVTVLLSGLTWALGALRGDGEPVIVTIPAQPAGAPSQHHATLAVEVTWSSPLRAHIDAVRAQLVHVLRAGATAGSDEACHAYFDSIAAHGTVTMPNAPLRVRHRGEGALWLDGPAALGHSWLTCIADALSVYLEHLATPDVSLREIPLWRGEAREAILALGRGPEAPAWLEGSLITAFEERVRADPTAVAVVDAERQLTYGQLNARAGNLAQELRSGYGLGAGSVIAVLVENVADAVVSAIAVWKLGAIELPLELEWPEPRITAVLSAAGAHALITQSHLLNGAFAHVPTFALDLQLEDHGAEDASIAAAVPDPGATAYVIFTSGTTGAPKAVRIAHRSVFNMLCDQAQFLRIRPGDRILQPFSLAFDASLLSIGLALVSGAAVVLLPRRLLGDPAALASFLRDRQVSIASFVPSMLRLLSAEQLSGVHTVIVGGEPLTPVDVERYGHGRRIVNSYGTTETACVAAAADVGPGLDNTLGSAVANSAVHVLNAEGQPMPLGVAGEICVEGASVAQGSTLHRTGDLGVRRTDGRLLLRGRIDRQLKLHGQRVEPAEIEAALSSIPGIRAAHVLLHGETLAAFIAGDDAPAPAAVAGALAAMLPRALVPSRIVRLTALPVSLNGKVDAHALRALLAAQAPSDTHAPESEAEERLAAIWMSILGCARPGVATDFFELGGSSLLALQVVWRVEEAFSVRVPLASFLARPTIRGLAESIARLPRIESRPALPSSSGPALRDLTSAQLGIWLDCQTAADAAAFHVPRVFTFREAIDADRLRAAVHALGQRHEALRTNFTVTADGPKQFVHAAPAARLELVEGLRDEEIAARIESLAWTPMELDHEPLLRVALLAGAGQSTLVMVAHHLVCDGASMSLLLDELAALYDGRTLAPPGLAHTEYVDASLAEERSGGLARLVEEWCERLSDTTARAALPERAHAASQPMRNGIVRLALPPLRQLAAARHTRPFQLACASLAAALSELAGEPRVAFGVPVSLRARPELERVVGCLLNIMVIQLRTAGAATFFDVLQHVESEVAWALERSDCPYVRIAGKFAAPLFDVELDYRASTIRSDPPSLMLGAAEGVRQPRRGGRGRKFGLDVLFTEEGDALRLEILFDETRHEPAVVEALAARMEELLAAAVAGHDLPLRTAARASRRDRLRRHLVPKERAETADLPIIRERRGAEPIAERLAADRELLGALAQRGGAVLYRDSGIGSAGDLAAAMQSLGQPLLRYTERSSDRREIAPLVYTSTEHPADQVIKLHTEHSYSRRWPMRITFCCIQAAARGGETPIAPVRGMMARLRPHTLARFREEGVLYVRNLGSGLGLDWPTVFGTNDRGDVDAYCRANDIETLWRDDDRLTLRFRRPALRPHPDTGEEVWFNHAYFFNSASLEPRLRAALREHCAPDDLPFQTFYGGGGEIPESVFDEIESAYAAVERPLAWHRGDLLILDNMMVAHGRRPFDGPRTVLVTMSCPHPPEQEPESTRRSA